MRPKDIFQEQKGPEQCHEFRLKITAKNMEEAEKIFSREVEKTRHLIPIVPATVGIFRDDHQFIKFVIEGTVQDVDRAARHSDS
jgi:hypothetical protein